MTSEPDRLEFARIAEALQAAPTPRRTAEEVVDYAGEELDADHAGVTLIRNGRLETIASTDDLVEQVDVWQYELDERPCRDSSWQRQTLSANDLAVDGRWPRWAERVVPLGIASVLAAELTNDEDRRLGALNLYWSKPHAFTADDLAFVNIFARHVALALVESLKEAGLNIGLDSRNRIGQAQGILMERYGLDQDQAFQVLRRYSQDHNIKLHQVADQLIISRDLPATWYRSR
jgi:GAF domain-containing protein